MKKILENIHSIFAALGTKFKRKPKDVSAVSEPVTTPRASSVKRKVDRFSVISWVVTILVVVTSLVSTILYKNSRPITHVSAAQPTSAAGEASGADQPSVAAPAIGEGGGGVSSIARKLQLITNIPERPRYDSVIYRVFRGDAMLSIAEDFKLKSETILYVNEQLEDNPHNLKPGVELIIPPVDGLYYTWKDGDTFDSIAEKFDTTADEIINFPGNKVDLTDPKIDVGVRVMIPGGSRELKNTLIPTSGGAGGSINACGGGPVASGFGWPAGSHNISGNGYGPGHLAIDIQANEGEPIYAAGSGIVTQAQGGWNYGYGNVVQIDHGNGYVTVYAHLSVINVGVCTPVGQGAVIGASGNTGNSFGAHLHFEVRSGGSSINPYNVVQ